MLNEIRAINCSLSKDLEEDLEERRTVYSSLLNFLKSQNKESDFDKCLDMTLIKSWKKMKYFPGIFRSLIIMK